MRKFWMLGLVRTWVSIVAILCFAFGCKNDDPQTSVQARKQPSSATSATATFPSEIPRAAQGRPQPRLPAIKLWIGTNDVTAEIAHTMPQIMSGMMWRTNMAETEAMLFVFPQPHRAQFWMRNTLLPLSCAYIDPEGTILELHDMKPRDETPIPAGTDQVQYVLEVNMGWFERHGVTPGMLISTDRGSLGKTFFGR